MNVNIENGVVIIKLGGSLVSDKTAEKSPRVDIF